MVHASKPFFSILIPSYNRPEDLRSCISSILQNTFTDYEIIISDDNSPKKNEVTEVISSFNEVNNLRFFLQPENLREPENKNFLVRLAVGKFNIIIADDDTLTENALTSLYNFIKSNEGHDIYGFGYNIVDELGDVLSTHSAPAAVVLNDSTKRKYILEAGTLPMTIFHPATFCCRTGLETELPYRSDIGIGEDLYFIFESVIKEKLICIFPEALFNWRKVQDQKVVTQSNQSAENLASFKSKVLIYEAIKKNQFINQEIRRYVNSYEYRCRFLYSEIIRAKNFKSLVDDGFFLEDHIFEELARLDASYLYSFRLVFTRIYRLFELTKIFGIVDTTLMMLNYGFTKLGWRHEAK